MTSNSAVTKSPLRLLVPGVVAMVALILGVVVLLNGQRERLPVISQVGAFSLTNQVGQQFVAEDLKGSIWIANIIFTHCPGPCREMSKRMSGLQRALEKHRDIKFLSLTADPAVDTPEVLKRYAELYHADPGRWVFLTGPKSEIVRLAIDDLKLTVVDKEERQRESPEDLFIHSTISVLVDRQGRLRGAVEALEPQGPDRLRDMALGLLRE